MFYTIFFRALKPAAYERKQLRKLPGKAVCSAVFLLCVRRCFRENFATQCREKNICHVWYFWPREADSSLCAVNVWIGLCQINQLANEIGLLAHVISNLKMAEIFKFWTSVQDGYTRSAKRQDLINSTFSFFGTKNLTKEKLCRNLFNRHWSFNPVF